ncbi:MAG: N-acetylneuraminate lyase [Clostridia bacterium]
MDTTKFKGIFPALLTPFTKDDQIDAKAIDKLVKMNIAKGVNGFYVGGSTGEGLLLTVDERKQLFKAAADANEGKTTLIAHVGSINTAHSIEMAKYAEEIGYDAISAVAPYYYSFGYEAIKCYYNDIANSVDIPMIMYNFPAANGFNFNKAMAEDMFQNKHFIAIKHTNADLYMLQQFKSMDCKPLVYNGFDEMLVAGLAMGADGGIGSTYNFMAEKFVAIYKAFNANDIARAKAIQEEVNEIITILIKYGVFAMEKGVLTEMGIEMGDCRKPFLPLSDDGKKACKHIIKLLAK